MYQVKRNNLIFLFLIVVICLIKLFHIGYYRINFSTNLLFYTFKKDFANNQAVSDNVLEAYQLIRKSKISNFNLSNKLYLNGYFKQRIVEFSYPIRLDTNSQFVLALSDSRLTCKVKLESKRIKLYEC
jgi:polyphosphate kinase